MENFMLSRNAHKKEFSSAFSACLVDFLSMHTQLSRESTISTDYDPSTQFFCSEKKLIDMKICMHEKNTNCILLCVRATQIAE